MACWSESRQALIFKRRQTQHKPSAELGAHEEPQTTHFVSRFNLSVWSVCLALSSSFWSITGSDEGNGLRLIRL